MANPQLVEYIRVARQANQSLEAIRSKLIQIGWSEFDIGLAWQAATVDTPTTSAPPKKAKHQSLSASELLLFIGGLIIIVAAATLIISGWRNLSPIGHVLAALIPNAILVAAGAIIMKSPSLQRAGHVFLVTGGLVVPVTVAIILWELMDSRSIDDDLRLLVTALVSLGIYGVFLRLYREIIWSTLMVIAGIVSYGALLSVVHIEDVIPVNPFAWAYAFFGAILIGVGILVESRGHQFYARTPYFFGAIAFIFSALVLGISGTLFGEDWLQSSGEFGGPQVFTTVIVGLVMLGIGHILSGLRNNGLAELGRQKPLWDFVGAVTFLGSFMLVMDKDASIMYSVIAIVLCAGFLFFALRQQNRQYFQAAAITLAATLLKTGMQYFADTLGWPVMLMFAGLVIMGGGYALARVQKNMFPPAQRAVEGTDHHPRQI